MTRSLRLVPILWCLLLIPFTTPTLRAESLDEEPPRVAQIRASDRHLRAAVEHGVRHSATFRELVRRINTSDVVVYLSCGTNTLPRGVEGRLTFVSRSGGFRYVTVDVDARLPLRHQVSIIGHELQHAVEIAETSSIVDGPSLARAYADHLGFQDRTRSSAYGRSFDSRAAVEAGQTVLREMLVGAE